MLGYALAATGQPGAARREYGRVLSTPDIDPVIREQVEAALAKLDPAD
jgi:hypothetical protein